MKFLGISHPFRKGPTGFPETAEDETLLRESLEQLVLTSRGERVMRPTFGCGAQALVFENKGPALVALMQRTIAKAIEENEPRVTLLDVLVEDKGDDGVLATVVYSVNGLPANPLRVSIAG